MAEVSVVLNQNVTAGAAVAAYQDGTSRIHQEVVVQTQNASSDPVSISLANPLPVGGNLTGDGVTDAGSSVKVGGVFNTTPPTLTNTQRGALQLDASGNLKINLVAGAAAGGTSSTVGAAVPNIATAVGFSDGTNMRLALVDGSGNLKVNIAAGGVAAQTDNTTFTSGATSGLVVMGVFNDGIGALTSGNAGAPRLTSDRKLLVAAQPTAGGGRSPFKLISAASTNATSVKGSAGTVGFIQVGNNLGTVAYLKLYNKASAPTVGTDTPVQVYMVPGNTAGAGLSLPLPDGGLGFATGIALAITGGIADADATAVAANQVAVNLGYA